MKAIVFIDVQNDFLKGGPLGFGYPAEDNLPKIVGFAEKCAADPECRLYATRDTHVADHVDVYDNRRFYEDRVTPEAIPYSMTLEGQKLPVPHCIEGQPGWRIADSLMKVLDGRCPFVNKPTFGSFDLADIIEEDVGFNGLRLDEIVLVGYCTSICVLANAVILRAKFPNTKISVMGDLCGCVSEESHRRALEAMKMQQIEIE